MHDTTHAELILEGGTIITMNPLQPRADAIAIAGGQVLAVGSVADVHRLAGPKTKIVDLAGRAVTPGLVDGHAHLYGLGKSLEELSFRGEKPDEIVAQVAKAAGGRDPSEWILGRGWDQNLWSPPDFPTAKLLADVKNPVALRRIDGHASWVNAAALAAAGITKDTKDPEGGKIVRDASGEPTGILVDNAMDLVDRKIPEPTADVRRRRILRAQDEALAQGLTGIHEMGIPRATIDVYRALARSGELKIRVYAFLDEGDANSTIEAMDELTPDLDRDGTAIFVLGGAKLYADGALGSRGAALLAPYADDPGNSGLVVTDETTLRKAAKVARSRGFQLAVHAIGDRGNRDVLDAYEFAGVEPARRFRIEHAQVVAPSDFDRFARMGIFAAMQPSHATSDSSWAEARLGPERIKGAYAWRTMLEHKVHVGGGSDFPIEEVSPIIGLWAATTRGGWHEEQKLTLDEAIHLYTVENAYGSFEEAHRGMLAPGFVADLTVYDRDLVVESIKDTQIDMTIIGGHVVYDRERGRGLRPPRVPPP